MGGVGTLGVVACVQEVAVTPGELLADADLIHYTMGASEKDEEEAIRKAVDFSTTARRQTVQVLTIDTNQPPASTHCAKNTLAPSNPLTPSPPKPERGPTELAYALARLGHVPVGLAIMAQFHERAFQPAIPTAGPTRWPGPALRAAPPESAPRLRLAGRR